MKTVDGRSTTRKRVSQRRRIFSGAGLLAAAVVMALASTAYACVVMKGDATVDGSTRTPTS